MNNLGQVSSPQNGDRAFQTTTRRWWRYDDTCFCWGSLNATPANWEGSYTNEAAADRHVDAVNDLTWWTGRPTIAQVTTYVEPGDDTIVCDWRPTQETQEFLARPTLPLPNNFNAGQYARINPAGTAYETAVVEDEVVFVSEANVTQVGGGVNHIEFQNTTAPTDGTIYHWASETTTTGGVQIRISGSDYGVFKAGETVGSFELFSGGEFENTIPQQVTFQDGALYWTATLLGTAASEDVGMDAGEIPVLNAGGKLNPELLGTQIPNDSNWLRGDGQWRTLPITVTANPGGTGNADLTSIAISGTNYDIPEVTANPGGQGNAAITSITIDGINYDVSIGDREPAALRHEINRIAALERITSQLSITEENTVTPVTVTDPIIARTTTLPTVAEARALTYATSIAHADSDTHEFYTVRIPFDADPDDYTMVLTEGGRRHTRFSSSHVQRDTAIIRTCLLRPAVAFSVPRHGHSDG